MEKAIVSNGNEYLEKSYKERKRYPSNIELAHIFLSGYKPVLLDPEEEYRKLNDTLCEDSTI